MRWLARWEVRFMYGGRFRFFTKWDASWGVSFAKQLGLPAHLYDRWRGRAS